MRRMLETMLKQYGTAMTLTVNGAPYPVRALFQPVRSKSIHYRNRQLGLLGRRSQALFTYIGPAEPAAQVGDTVCVDGKSYVLRQSEVFRDHEGPVYRWALCMEAEEAL